MKKYTGSTQRTFKRDPDESYEISESSSRDPDAPHASESWPEEEDRFPGFGAQVEESHNSVGRIESLERLNSEKDSTIATLWSEIGENDSRTNNSALQQDSHDERFVIEVETRIDLLVEACAVKDQTIFHLESSVQDLEIMCKEYSEEIEGLKASVVGGSPSSFAKKDREFFDMSKQIRQQAMEIHTMRDKMNYWKETIIPDLERQLEEKDQALAGFEFGKKWKNTEGALDVRVPPSSKRERAMAEFETRQLNAIIEDLQEQLRLLKKPSELQHRLTELQVELEIKQMEIDDMGNDLEDTMHKLWLAEERNQKLQKMLDHAPM